MPPTASKPSRQRRPSYRPSQASRRAPVFQRLQPHGHRPSGLARDHAPGEEGHDPVSQGRSRLEPLRGLRRAGADQRSSAQGQDAIFNLVPPGDLFGEIALLDGGRAPRMRW